MLMINDKEGTMKRKQKITACYFSQYEVNNMSFKCGIIKYVIITFIL